MVGTFEQLSHVRFDELAVFVEVAAAGSIAAAAKRLGVPKSTVGRAVTRIEQDLGVTLVRRMISGPALTEPGRVLAALAAPHVAALRDVTSALGRHADEAYGTLRVTAPPDIGALVIAPLLPTIAARHPRVHVELDLSMRVTELVREGFDCAIRVTNARGLSSSGLVQKRLAKLELGLYASPAYLARMDTPKRPEDLLQHDFVAFSGRDGKSVLSFDGPKGHHKLTVRSRTTANDFFFLREALAAGTGIGALPWFVAHGDLLSGRLVRLMPDYRLPGTTAFLVHAPTTTPSPKFQAFRALLLEHGVPLLTRA
jgi:DNA-binding transcriptional LysR family regulator